MNTKTRAMFTSFLTTVATINGVANATEQFTVEPSVEQKLEKRIQDSAEFLGLINSIPVDQIKGEKVGIGVTRSIAGRTDIDNNERDPSDPTGEQNRTYECQDTEYDTAIKYKRLDVWRHKPEFETLVRDAIIKQHSLDRIMIGFNGTHVAAQTNRTTYPLLQDVNKGWLQKIRDDAATQHLDGVNIGTGPSGAVYKNIDQAVMDAVDLLHESYRDDDDLVVICNRTLTSDKYTGLAGEHEEPTEKEALSRLMKNKKIGGLPVIEAPYFPRGAFLITKLSNLSIYWQQGSRRRHLADEPTKKRVADYQSVNECFEIEDYEACAFVENIQVPTADNNGWEAF